jgi:hypothetical protein
LQIADCRLQIADCRLQIADCRLQIADCRLQIADCRLQIDIQSIKELLSQAKPEKDLVGIKLPQADSFESVINLCQLLSAS